MEKLSDHIWHAIGKNRQFGQENEFMEKKVPSINDVFVTYHIHATYEYSSLTVLFSAKRATIQNVHTKNS